MNGGSYLKRFRISEFGVENPFFNEGSLDLGMGLEIKF